MSRRDSMDQITLLNGLIADRQMGACITGCTEEQREEAVSPEEKEIWRKVIAFAYSAQGRRLSEKQLMDAVNAWCVKEYEGQ